MDVLVFIGPPLSGKGTHSELIAKKTGWVHISTGDLLRERMKIDDEIGKNIKDTMAAGQFASPEIIEQIMAELFANPKYQDATLILDGYPRDLPQMQELEQLTKQQSNINFKGAVLIDVPYNTLFNRLAQRGRADDKPDILQKRLKDYERRTKLVADLYGKQAKLIRINGDQSLESASADICRALGIKDKPDNNAQMPQTPKP